MNFFLVGGYFLDGFATAAEQLAGRAIGAGSARAFTRAIRSPRLGLCAVRRSPPSSSCCSAADLVAIVTTAEDVRAATVAFIPWAAFTAMSGVLAFQMDGVFIGATWSRDMRNMMLLSFAAYLRRALRAGAGLRQSRAVGVAARLPAGARLQPAVAAADAGCEQAFAAEGAVSR